MSNVCRLDFNPTDLIYFYIQLQGNRPIDIFFFYLTCVQKSKYSLIVLRWGLRVRGRGSYFEGQNLPLIYPKELGVNRMRGGGKADPFFFSKGLGMLRGWPLGYGYGTLYLIKIQLKICVCNTRHKSICLGTIF